MATSDIFTILIIDSDGKSRNMLKNAALSLPCFKKVLFCSSLDEGFNFGNGFEAIDVVTISHRFKIEDSGEFIKKVKKTPRGKQWAFITVVTPSSKQNEIIAENMLNGVDGFLFEPFSADNLKEMAEVTAKVKLENEYARMKSGLEILLDEVAKHLDAVAYYASQNKVSASAKNKLLESSKKLNRFKTENWDMYVEVVTELFPQISAPAGRKYQGVSQRVRDRMKAKMMAELENEYKE